MPRYFAEIAYNGTEYSGWQIQPNALTVQEVIESSLKQILGSKVEVAGCGRTDAGVHATQFYFHFDLNEEPLDFGKLLYQLNAVLPNSVVFYRIVKVKEDAHARFDATQRAYVYKMHFGKNPFEINSSFKLNNPELINFEKLNQAAKTLLEFEDFFPFCKTKTEVATFKCEISNSNWTKKSETHWEYHVSANRFLRGMVRLIVGMTINVGTGKVSIDKLRECMEKQIRLPHAWSVPAEGLYLREVKYPYL